MKPAAMGFMDYFRHGQRRPAAPPRRDAGHQPGAAPQAEGFAEAITVSRTLVKSEPELAELVYGDPRFSAEDVEVELAEKGFGTRVEITAPAGGDLGLQELETLLDELAEPQRRPFSKG